MKINPVSNYVQNFGKTLLGTTTVRGARCGLKEVNVMEYSPCERDDILQISSLKKTWGNNAQYIKEIISDFVDAHHVVPGTCNEDAYFYGLEDKNGKTLAIAEILEASPDTLSLYDDEISYSYINYIQVDPSEQCGVKSRHYKGLGESLVAEIVKLAKFKNKAVVQLTSENDAFWDKCKFFMTLRFGINGCEEKILSAENFDNFTNYVENKKTKLDKTG